MKIIENLKEKFNNIKNNESNHFKNSDFDLEFISKIQPAGNIIFKENYIKKGDGFETCVEIYDYPETVRNFWLRTITNFNIENLIVTIDISTMDNAIVDSVLEKNLKENKYIEKSTFLNRYHKKIFKFQLKNTYYCDIM